MNRVAATEGASKDLLPGGWGENISQAQRDQRWLRDERAEQGNMEGKVCTTGDLCNVSKCKSL